MSPVEVIVGVAVRGVEGNPWLDRLVTSVREIRCGVEGVPLWVESGTLLTKVEKMLRLRNRAAESGARWLCVLEDDAEAVHDGWLAALVDAARLARAAVVGPGEAHPQADLGLIAETARNGQVSEATNVGGFCTLLDVLVQGVAWDVRCQTASDLWLCLRARSLGHRIAYATTALLRHTKEPWARDGTPPWEQEDRSRFGEGDAYYARDWHQAKRVAEARLMVAEFGDLARAALPPELLAVFEPGAVGEQVVCPGCSGCRKLIPLGERYVMGSDGARCFPCAGVVELPKG